MQAKRIQSVRIFKQKMLELPHSTSMQKVGKEDGDDRDWTKGDRG